MLIMLHLLLTPATLFLVTAYVALPYEEVLRQMQPMRGKRWDSRVFDLFSTASSTWERPAEVSAIDEKYTTCNMVSVFVRIE